MSSLFLIITAIVLFLIAYIAYGGYLAKKWGLDPNRKTPAHEMNDGVDYVPATAPVLLGHHFASIAGAAPIIGPIAASVFGWIPVFLWIVIGGIFFGAVHDFGALFASVRHGGKSIGEIINKNMGESGKKLFNIFAWLTLVLVIAAFMVVTARTFVSVPSAATSSLLFILLAIGFGFVTNRSGIPLGIATIGGVILLFLCVIIGLRYPLALPQSTWIYIFMVYIFIASVAPVWILLQPRDYLNSFLLYSMLIGAVIGIFVTRPALQLASYSGFKTNLGYMFPVLFVTVACGAISGFHSLVSSGTSSKQLNKETDAQLIGYGGMLIECVLATIALITAAVVAKDKLAELLNAGGPVNVFSTGVGNFMAGFGIPAAAGKSFAALAVSAFAMTTLDTATRLGRFIFQELFEISKGEEGKKLGVSNMYVATFVTVAAGSGLALSGQWAAIWPIFGSANQLLAALALLAVSVWLAAMGKDNTATKIPMFFMFAVTLSALGTLIFKNFGAGNQLLGGIGTLLFILAIVLAFQAYKVLSGTKKNSIDA